MAPERPWRKRAGATLRADDPSDRQTLSLYRSRYIAGMFGSFAGFHSGAGGVGLGDGRDVLNSTVPNSSTLSDDAGADAAGAAGFAAGAGAGRAD